MFEPGDSWLGRISRDQPFFAFQNRTRRTLTIAISCAGRGKTKGIETEGPSFQRNPPDFNLHRVCEANADLTREYSTRIDNLDNLIRSDRAGSLSRSPAMREQSSQVARECADTPRLIPFRFFLGELADARRWPEMQPLDKITAY